MIHSYYYIGATINPCPSLPQVTKFATVRMALSGESFMSAGRDVVELLRRNMMDAYTVWWVLAGGLGYWVLGQVGGNYNAVYKAYTGQCVLGGLPCSPPQPPCATRTPSCPPCHLTHSHPASVPHVPHAHPATVSHTYPASVPHAHPATVPLCLPAGGSLDLCCFFQICCSP